MSLTVCLRMHLLYVLTFASVICGFFAWRCTPFRFPRLVFFSVPPLRTISYRRVDCLLSCNLQLYIFRCLAAAFRYVSKLPS